MALRVAAIDGLAAAATLLPRRLGARAGAAPGGDAAHGAAGAWDGDGSWLSPALAGAGPAWPAAAPANGARDALELLANGCAVLQMAVPKSKPSLRVRRIRQNSQNKRLRRIQHFSPCTKCDKGFMKLRHHLCVCDMEKVNAPNGRVVRVTYGDNV